MNSGYVALIGRPSVGKSTLMNKLCGRKVAIVSPIPQTTRNQIRGIVNRPSGQIILLDTPGLHQSERNFNRRLRRLTLESLDAACLILYILDISRPFGPEEEAVAADLSKRVDKLCIALNKTDTASVDQPQAKWIQKRFPGTACWPISAQTGAGLDDLVDGLLQALPAGEALYPQDIYTDQKPEFRISEIIREQALLFAREEVPHSLFVEVIDLEIQDKTMMWIRAVIAVERSSQQGILVGKNGRVIKAIRQASQKEIGRLFGYRVHLDLRVKTKTNWRNNEKIVSRHIF